jgi:hypothetical protein
MQSLESTFPALRGFPVGRVGFEGGKSTLVPSVFFVPGDEEKYLAFNAGLTPQEVVMRNVMRRAGGINIFSIHTGIERYIYHRFGVSEPIHHLTALAEGILAGPSGTGNPVLALHSRGRYIDILVSDGTDLLFANSFAVTAPEDTVYFVIFVLEQLGIETAKAQIRFLGDLDPDSREVHILQRYTGRQEFGERPSAFQFSKALEGIPSHRMWALFNLPLCGS